MGSVPKFSAQHMKSLPEFFADIPDPPTSNLRPLTSVLRPLPSQVLPALVLFSKTTIDIREFSP